MRAGGWRKRLPKGATVALMMRNRPEYAAIWLGLTRIGAVVALDQPRTAAAPRLRMRSPPPKRALAIASPEGAAAMRGRRI